MILCGGENKYLCCRDEGIIYNIIMVEDYMLTSLPDSMRLINDQKADRPGGRGETYDG